MISSATKALSVVSLFSAAGVVGWLFVPDPAASAPLMIFYAALMVNTYYSVRFFERIIPTGNKSQMAADTVLVILYFYLAYSLLGITQFLFADLLLFIASVGKYALLLRVLKQPALLKRKLFINSLGMLGAMLALVLAVVGFALFAAWLLAVCFVIANIFLLFIRPMYHLDEAK